MSDRHYGGEVEDAIIGRLAAVSYIAVPKIRTFSCGLTMLCRKVVDSVFCGHTVKQIKQISLPFHFHDKLHSTLVRQAKLSIEANTTKGK